MTVISFPPGLENQLVRAALRGEMDEVAELAEGIKLIEQIANQMDATNAIIQDLGRPSSSRVRTVDGGAWNDTFLSEVIKMQGLARDTAELLDSFLRRQTNT